MTRRLPCLNVACPDEALVPAIELFGQSFRLLCWRCAAEAEERDRLDADAARRAELLGRVQVGPRYRQFSLASYPDDSAGAQAKLHALHWLEGFRGGSRRDLLLVGAAGVGKTGLAWSLVRELIEVDLVEADMVNLRDLLASIRSAFASGKTGDPTKRLREIGLLCLDDVGAERPTEWALEELARIVEERYQWQRPTIWTSNYRPQLLVGHFGHDDQVVGERLVSRMTDGALIVKVEGGDRRSVRMRGGRDGRSDV